MEFQKSILIIDDDPIGVEIIINALEESYTVSVSYTGNDGIKKALKNAPDLILLDINMPGLDGYETIQILKKTPGLEQIPVIFVSSISDEYNEEKGFKLGAVDYIIKPVKPGVLRARIQIHLNHSILDQKNQSVSEESDPKQTGKKQCTEGYLYKKNYVKPDQVDGLIKILYSVLHDEEIYLNDDIRISHVAEAMGMRTHHLQELLNRYMNVTFSHLIHKLRIEKAVSLMENSPEIKIIEIVYESGFQSRSVFNNAFKEITGKTPSQYRDECRDSAKLK